ncbi:hypothetical protein BC938DRAFT_471867 [Jimgerdemannia flammicorona]|uniref:Uncharacterized protein n=1 Tax=Jimgerdemannia flammicorona TaxID=994334 RepID=A0A433Q774_9FUNG|nr:hypothetical protein BC938DRAFT_471867 [Jimgerdemannia flammicorona]
MPYLLTLSAFCDNVRERKPHVDFLKLSDKLLWRILGCLWTINMIVKALVKLVPRENLIKVREAKQAREAEKAQKGCASGVRPNREEPTQEVTKGLGGAK